MATLTVLWCGRSVAVETTTRERSGTVAPVAPSWLLQSAMHAVGCRHTRDDARALAGRIAATVTGRTEYRHELRHWIGHGMTEPPAGAALIVIWRPTPGCQAELESLNTEKSGRISI